MYAMPFCPACGEPIKVDTKYCPKCGYDIGGGEGRKPKMCKCPRCKGKGKVPGVVLEGRVITWLGCPKCNGKKVVRGSDL